MEVSMSRGAWILLLASVAVVAFGLFVAAVNGGLVEVNASPRNTAKQLDACALFTTPDAQELLGPAAWGSRLGGDTSCSYLSGPPVSSPGSPPPTLMTINVYAGQPLPVSESYDGGSPQSDSAVRGLGNHARWYFYGHGAAGVLEVDQGTHVVRLLVGDAPDNNKATAIAAARVILSRLP